MDKQKRKFGLKELLLLAGSLFATQKAYAGTLEVKHDTLNGGVNPDPVFIVDNDDDDPYLGSPPPALRAYFRNSLGDRLMKIGIDPIMYEKRKIYLEPDSGVPEGTERFLKLKFWNKSGYGNRNVILFQDPNNKNADPNIYDVLGLAWEVEENYIPLPAIVVPDTNNAQEWYVTSTNLADINFDGKINFLDLAKLGLHMGTSGHGQHDNWANFADIDRDGKVDKKDLGFIADNWLWDGTTQQLVSKYDGKSRYEIQKARLRKDRKLFANHAPAYLKVKEMLEIPA